MKDERYTWHLAWLLGLTIFSAILFGWMLTYPSWPSAVVLGTCLIGSVATLIWTYLEERAHRHAARERGR